MSNPSVWDAYFSALGRFMHGFARTEDLLNNTLANFVRQHVGPIRPNGHEVIRAVLGGQRLAPLKDALKRVLKATRSPTEMRSKVDDLFDQLAQIQFVRIALPIMQL